jgi:hypothetical protein
MNNFHLIPSGALESIALIDYAAESYRWLQVGIAQELGACHHFFGAPLPPPGITSSVLGDPSASSAPPPPPPRNTSSPLGVPRAPLGDGATAFGVQHRYVSTTDGTPTDIFGRQDPLPVDSTTTPMSGVQAQGANNFTAEGDIGSGVAGKRSN